MISQMYFDVDYMSLVQVSKQQGVILPRSLIYSISYIIQIFQLFPYDQINSGAVVVVIVW